MKEIEKSFEAVQTRIEKACGKAGRKSSSIELLAVSKRQPIEKIQHYIQVAQKYGARVLLGENQVQEFDIKSTQLPSELSKDTSTHLIGHLQSNKAKKAVELFDCIQSVDSLKLLQLIDKEAQKIDKKIPIFLQVNISGDPKKYGFLPEELSVVIGSVKESTNISLEGLMTITKLYEHSEEARSDFKAMYDLKNSIDTTLKLSMGMSADFDIAIEEGADIVRVGSALFGVRK
jgi:pyridoxal phosphate enzyme (YggS family)